MQNGKPLNMKKYNKKVIKEKIDVPKWKRNFRIYQHSLNHSICEKIDKIRNDMIQWIQSYYPDYPFDDIHTNAIFNKSYLALFENIISEDDTSLNIKGNKSNVIKDEDFIDWFKKSLVEPEIKKHRDRKKKFEKAEKGDIKDEKEKDKIIKEYYKYLIDNEIPLKDIDVRLYDGMFVECKKEPLEKSFLKFKNEIKKLIDEKFNNINTNINIIKNIKNSGIPDYDSPELINKGYLLIFNRILFGYNPWKKDNDDFDKWFEEFIIKQRLIRNYWRDKRYHEHKEPTETSLQGKDNEDEENSVSILDNFSSENDDPEKATIAIEESMTIIKAIKAIEDKKKDSWKYQDPIILNFYGRLTTENISEIMKEEHGTIRTWKRRGLEMLKNYYQKIYKINYVINHE